MIAVVCPTRGRPEACAQMVVSALKTSNADVLLYVDSDDPNPYKAYGDRIHVFVGDPIGRGAAVNALCDLFRDYRLYLVVSDDIIFTRPGWDEEIAQEMDAFGGDIGLVHLKGSNTQQTEGEPWVNWACVSRSWIDALGWLNYPECNWFCQDTVLQILAEALGRITQIPRVAIHHSCINHPEWSQRLQHDTERFLWFCAKDFGSCLKKLKEAM